MSEKAIPEAVIQTKAARRGRVSPIWIIPILCVVLGLYLVWHQYNERGPTITITFKNAEGLTAGQSRVRLRDVDVGTVQTITLNPDFTGVVLTVQMDKGAARLLNENARFWVVKPRLFAGSLQGLGTLVSGSYIAILPSHEGEPRRAFTGLEDPPIQHASEPGRTVLLNADRLGSLSLGSPIFYRDLTVGEVRGWDFSDMARSVTIHAFIRAPFDQYLREGSRFWDASGISLQLGADGVRLQVESLRAILLGGIAFDTPDAASPAAQTRQAFPLYSSQQEAINSGTRRRVPAVSFFTEPVTALTVGAAVVFQGVRIGQVLGHELEYDPATRRPHVRVRYEIEPDRITGLPINAQPQDRAPVAAELVRQGLRARLASANLLTGQQQISLDFVTDAPPAELRLLDGMLLLPSAPGQFNSILDAVNRVLVKVEDIPFRQIGENLNSTIAGVDTLVRSPELRDSLASLDATLKAAQEFVTRLDAAAIPAIRSLTPMLNNLQGTVTQANRLIGSVQRGYGDESQFRRDLDRMLEQFNATARSLRSLVDTLNRNPEALIRGRPAQGTP